MNSLLLITLESRLFRLDLAKKKSHVLTVENSSCIVFLRTAFGAISNFGKNKEENSPGFVYLISITCFLKFPLLTIIVLL